ncbi:lipopolysaccharide biosynthesis protein, partial [Streptococcus pneumoniae]
IGDEQKSLEYVDKTMWVVLVITMGCAFGLAGVSATFAPVYWGEEFRASSQIIAGMTPALVFSAFGNVIRTQFLIPRSFDKEYTVSLLYGAVVNILINILLIPKMGAMGAVIGIIVAELVLCCYQTWIARNYLH